MRVIIASSYTILPLLLLPAGKEGKCWSVLLVLSEAHGFCTEVNFTVTEGTVPMVHVNKEGNKTHLKSHYYISPVHQYDN